MRNSTARNEREVGYVTSVSSYKVTVLLDPEIRSQVRAYPERIALISQIGGYLLFPVAPGELAVGIIVSASEDEAIEPDVEAGMTLQLTRARRVLRLNLLGQLYEVRPFSPGVSVYPTLETPALLPTEDELKRILEFKPREPDKDEDTALPLGVSPVYARQEVTASYNDILARALAIIGNTGSGKSYSVASLIQSGIRLDKAKAQQAKFIVLDINGEYLNALVEQGAGTQPKHAKEINRVYVNGQPFHLPLWTFNLSELVAFFEASQASQVPVLERLVTSLREEAIDPKPAKDHRKIVRLIDHCLDCLGSLSVYAAEVEGKAVCDNASEVLKHLLQYFEGLKLLSKTKVSIPSNVEKIDTEANKIELAGLKKREEYNQLRKKSDWTGFSRMDPKVSEAVQNFVDTLEPAFQAFRQLVVSQGGLKEVTADSPVKFDMKGLQRDALFQIATARFRGHERIQEYVATLRLRIHRQLSDRRWNIFTEEAEETFESIMKSICGQNGNKVVVIDCSMLAYDVLPFFCAVLGRLILELRAHTPASKRTRQPFVIVLEESHNYLKPRREGEDPGIRLSRETFERIAKEGRKFGLSLVIASQRPADVSSTVLSQCANFIVHRIQNPEDIEYFKKILPTGSRDMLDQLPILAPGDGLLIGSSVNVPARVKILKPSPEPESETPKPWLAWREEQPGFDMDEAMNLWVQESSTGSKQDSKGGAPDQQAKGLTPKK